MGRGQRTAAAQRRLRERARAQAAAVAALARAEADQERERVRRDAVIEQAEVRLVAAEARRKEALRGVVEACGSVQVAAQLLEVPPRELRGLRPRHSDAPLPTVATAACPPIDG